MKESAIYIKGGSKLTCLIVLEILKVQVWHFGCWHLFLFATGLHSEGKDLSQKKKKRLTKSKIDLS